MQDQSADAQDSRISTKPDYKFLDMALKEMLTPYLLIAGKGAAKFSVQLPVHFSLHDENGLASTLWSGIGRCVVTRLDRNPNLEEALT